MGLKVAMAPVDECSSSSKCQLSTGCSNVLVVEDAPLVVNANSTALVGVTAYVEAQCKCNVLTFDRCTAGSCLNGGTCQQLDNAFRSVDMSKSKKVKSFPSHKTHRAALISVSLALSQLTLRDHEYGAVYRAVCLFTLQLSLVLIAPIHGGMARLS